MAAQNAWIISLCQKVLVLTVGMKLVIFISMIRNVKRYVEKGRDYRKRLNAMMVILLMGTGALPAAISKRTTNAARISI
ncbi:MAG: hypothetical protein QF535_00530 [Anaerolineales bacterium]|nr:hypothetical protein [Anaerolineales bacterium]